MIATGMVIACRDVKIEAKKNSFQVCINAKIADVESAGAASGKTIRKMT